MDSEINAVDLATLCSLLKLVRIFWFNIRGCTKTNERIAHWQQWEMLECPLYIMRARNARRLAWTPLKCIPTHKSSRKDVL